MSNKIKVGYLPLYIKLYDDSNPHTRDPMVAYMNSLTAMLESQGIELVMADDVCRIKPEFEAAAKKFNDADVVAVITQHLAYSPSLESIDALLSLKAPIIVFDTTLDYELVSAMQYAERTGPNHGIHGVQDMCNLLLQNGKPYYICAGHALHSDVVARVAGMCRAAAVARSFATQKIGSVGGSFTGMGDFLISDERYKKDIGAEVKYMTPDVVKKYLAQVTEEEIDKEIEYDKANFQIRSNWPEVYRESTRSGLAMRKWMEAEGLTSATMNFLTLDECGLPKVPFVECCKILGRGQGYAGEGDVLTAGLVGSLMSVYPNTTFTEMFSPDWKENVILLSHMGESNPNLAQWKPCADDRPFNYNSTGDTIAMHNCYRAGKVVYVNLAPMKDHFHLIVFNAELLGIGLEGGAYTRETQGWLKPCMPVDELLTKYSEVGGTHHSAMVYDADINEIKAFGKMMGFEVIELK